MMKRSLRVQALVPVVVVGVAAACLAGCSGSDSAQVSSSSNGATTGGAGVSSASVGVFTYSSVAAGKSQHYVVMPGGGDELQGGDPLKDSPSKGGAATSSPVMTEAKPVKTEAKPVMTSAKPVMTEAEPVMNSAGSGSEGAVSEKSHAPASSWEPVLWDELKTLDKSKVNAELMSSWRILEDSKDPKRLGFSYGMMETGILVVAIPEGMLISWDPKKMKGTVKIERNGTQIAAVEASAGHYLDKDVAKLREYSYKIHRDRGGEGRWGMLALDAAYPPDFERKTLQDLAHLKAAGIQGLVPAEKK